MAGMYIIAGIMHFIKPRTYLRIMPRYLPGHKLLVLLSGIAEIILGLALCYPYTQDLAVWGIILMLLVFLMVHFYMLTPAANINLPRWLLILRLPLQLGLMWWAYSYL